MRPYAEVIGDPIAHSRSPALHRFWLEALGLDGSYRAVNVRRDELATYLAERRTDPAWHGCNLTAPLKEEVIPFLDALSGDASAIGAVNCVVRDNGRLIGANTDVDGIAEALPVDAITGKSIVVIGAGGAAKAALHYLVRCSAKHIRVLARRPNAARHLESIAVGHSRLEIQSLATALSFAGADVVLNASPLGMTHAAMPEWAILALAEMGPKGLVFDMVYEPLETPLLKAARTLKLAAVDGLTMLIGQADGAFRLFFEACPPRARDRQLREHLTRAFSNARPPSGVSPRERSQTK